MLRNFYEHKALENGQQMRRCLDCQSIFVLHENEMLSFARKQMSLPKRCDQCRAARRAAGTPSGNAA